MHIRDFLFWIVGLPSVVVLAVLAFIGLQQALVVF